MRVATVIASAERGGAEIHVEHLIRNVPEVEHIVITFADGPLAERWRTAGARVIPFPFRGKWRPGVTRQLAALLRSIASDVVHTHQPKANVYGTRAAQRAGVPAVMSVHGSHHQFLHSRGWLAAGLYARLDRLAASRSDSVIAVSNHTRWALIDEAGIPRKKIRLIRNGIPDPGWSQTIPERDFTAGFLGRFSREKGIHLLPQIIASSPPQLKNWVVAGSGPERGWWETERAKLNVPVEDLEWVEDPDEFFRKIHLLVVPSLAEGASLTIMEALARGIPVVATRVGGNRELLGEPEEEDKAGMVVPPRGEGLTLGMSTLLQQPQTMRRFAEMGRVRYERRFTAERMGRETRELYNELAGLRG